MRPNTDPLLSAAKIEEMPEQSASHPLNPASEIHGRSLSDAVGLQRVGFHLVRIPPGKEANIVHSHQFQEEFFYVLSGRGTARIDGRDYDVGPGDFMGFPTPSVAHGLANTGDEDLVYLVGGERGAYEVGEFPEIGKILFRTRQRALMVDRDDVEVFWSEEKGLMDPAEE